jgi:hypothetical protein
MEANAIQKAYVTHGRESHSRKILANISEQNKQYERRKRILEDNIEKGIKRNQL